MADQAWRQLVQHADLTATTQDAQETTPNADYDAVAAAAEEPAPSPRLLRAAHAMQVQGWDAALALLTQEAAERPGSYLAHDLRAACWLQCGRPEQALDDAMQATKLQPLRARAWARLGAAQLCLGHPRPAAAAYRRGLELEPGGAELALGLALAQEQLAAQGDRRKAMHDQE